MSYCVLFMICGAMFYFCELPEFWQYVVPILFMSIGGIALNLRENKLIEKIKVLEEKNKECEQK